MATWIKILHITKISWFSSCCSRSRESIWSCCLAIALGSRWLRLVSRFRPGWEPYHSPLCRRVGRLATAAAGPIFGSFYCSVSGQPLACPRLTSIIGKGTRKSCSRRSDKLAAEWPHALSGWMDLNGQGPNGFIDYDPSSQRFISHLSHPLWYDGQIVAR